MVLALVGLVGYGIGAVAGKGAGDDSGNEAGGRRFAGEQPAMAPTSPAPSSKRKSRRSTVDASRQR